MSNTSKNIISHVIIHIAIHLLHCRSSRNQISTYWIKPLAFILFAVSFISSLLLYNLQQMTISQQITERLCHTISIEAMHDPTSYNSTWSQNIMFTTHVCKGNCTSTYISLIRLQILILVYFLKVKRSKHKFRI